MLDAAMREKLEALRRRLAERLPGMVAELEDVVRRCLESPADPGRREPAVRGSHTLAGTAGTYGFLDLGRAARGLELLLRDGAAPVAVEAGLAELRRAFAVTLAPPAESAVQRSA